MGTYTITTTVDANNNPVNTGFSVATITNAISNMNKGNFALAVKNTIAASSSTFASAISSLSVTAVTSSDVLITVESGARATAALAVAYAMAALAAAVLPLW